MVDREPGEYRPRRAYIEPEPTEQEAASADTATPEQDDSRSRGSRYQADEHDQRPARGYEVDPRRNGNGYHGTPRNGDFGQLPPRRSIFADLDTEDRPRPLYRDESYGPSVRPDFAPPYGLGDQDDDHQLYRQDDQDDRQQLYRPDDQQTNVHQLYEQRPYQPQEDEGFDDPFAEPYAEEVTEPLYRNDQPAWRHAGDDRTTQLRSTPSEPTRRPRVRDEDATTRLPRTASGSRNTRDWPDSIDDFDDLDDGRPRIGRRTRLALVIAGVAAVVVAGLVVGYLLLQPSKTLTPSPTPRTTVNTQPSASGASNPTSQPSAVALSDDWMINAKDAKLIDGKRTWRVAATQHGRTGQSPAPPCLGGDPVQGQPTPQQTVLRMLTASGKNSPEILHEADAYSSLEEATLAYAVAAKTLGGCVEPGGWIESGWSVSGLGDQSVGLIVGIVEGPRTMHHSIVLSQTGLVLNVADVAQSPDAVGVSNVARALAAAINAQCPSSGGKCARSLAVKPGPPPLGGDQPGFLAAGDLPPVKGVTSSWVGNDPDLPSADFLGAQCENVDWAKTPAVERTARTYLLQEGSDPGFGLDEITLKMQSVKAAAGFMDTLKKTVTGCPKRKLTATVPRPNTVKGVGAGGAQINGWTVTVTQKATDRTNKYRLGVVTVGSKVVYSFLSPKGNYDLTDEQWDVVAVRAGERASQTN